MPPPVPHPTEAELDRHRRAVDKLRNKLFCSKTPKDFHIVDEPTVVAPSVYELSDTHGIRRTLKLGGLRFTIDRGVHPHDFLTSIVHDREDKFEFVVSENHHTMKAMTVAFADLDSMLGRVVESIRKSNINPTVQKSAGHGKASNKAGPTDLDRKIRVLSARLGDMILTVGAVNADQKRRLMWSEVTAVTVKKVGGVPVASVRARLAMRLLPREDPLTAQRRMEEEALRALSLSRQSSTRSTVVTARDTLAGTR